MRTAPQSSGPLLVNIIARDEQNVPCIIGELLITTSKRETQERYLSLRGAAILTAPPSSSRLDQAQLSPKKKLVAITLLLLLL